MVFKRKKYSIVVFVAKGLRQIVNCSPDIPWDDKGEHLEIYMKFHHLTAVLELSIICIIWTNTISSLKMNILHLSTSAEAKLTKLWIYFPMHYNAN